MYLFQVIRNPTFLLLDPFTPITTITLNNSKSYITYKQRGIVIKILNFELVPLSTITSYK